MSEVYEAGASLPARTVSAEAVVCAKDWKTRAIAMLAQQQQRAKREIPESNPQAIYQSGSEF